MTTTARTIAERISAALGDDGTNFRTNDGVTLDTLAEHYDGALEMHPRRPDACRWTFPDGSVITAAGCAWDIGFPDCWCWAGAQHEFHPAPNGACDIDPSDRDA